MSVNDLNLMFPGSCEDSFEYECSFMKMMNTRLIFLIRVYLLKHMIGYHHNEVSYSHDI